MRYISNRSRWTSELGWLSSRFSFSFAEYYDPARMHFGALRVLNDDTIAPGAGFPMHPHRDMEIVTIVLDGVVEHEDNMGNRGRTAAGEIQVMSAGTGVMHSEYNPDPMVPLKLLQIWVLPNVLGAKGSYAQMRYELVTNEFTTLVNGTRGTKVLPIRQDASFSIGKFDQNAEGGIVLAGESRWVYLFVIDGEFEVDGQVLEPRDALELTGPGEFKVLARKPGRLLKIEVPLFDSTLQ